MGKNKQENSVSGITRRQFVTGAGLGGAALLTAGGLKKGEAAPIPKKWDMETDIVIVGFGGAGACAAIEASKAGASVLILEKTEAPGGCTAISGGIVLAAGTELQKSMGISDTPEEMFKYIRACGQGRADDALIKVVADMSAENIAWLQSLGAEFPKELLAMSGMEDEPEYAKITPPRKRGHRCKGTGSALFKVLYNAVKAQKNVKVLLNAEGYKLITKPTATLANSEVIGIVAKRAGKDVSILAKRAVILTTGGIMSSEATKKWLQDYSPEVALTVPAGSLNATGDGYRMGIYCGAAMAGLNTGGYLPSVMFPGQKMGGIVYVNIWGLPNIYVKADGTRFCNEGAYYVLVAETMFASKATTAYCVFDSETIKKALDMVPKGIEATRTLALGVDPRNMEKGIQGGYLWKGETIGELAKNMGISGTALEKTVSDYNQNAASGKDPEFNRKKGLAPLKTSPYYAFQIHVGMVCHDGGLKINPKAQVIDSYGNVIPRLYAAGRDSVGLFGERYPGSGGALTDLLAFGRVAGKVAPAEKPQKK